MEKRSRNTLIIIIICCCCVFLSNDRCELRGPRGERTAVSLHTVSVSTGVRRAGLPPLLWHV